MSTFDVTTPYDELDELRSVLTAQQIGELTGLRRETISRARRDRRFQRRTEAAVANLYAVVRRMRPILGDDLGQLAAVLWRPQPLLSQRSIADLLKAGEAEAVLAHLAALRPSEDEQLEDLRFDPAVEAELAALEESDPTTPAEIGMPDARVAALVASDPELASRVPSIETKIRDRFGYGARIEPAIVADSTAPDGQDRLYLGIRSELSFEVEIDRLAALLSDEEELLGPVQARLSIGTL